MTQVTKCSTDDCDRDAKCVGLCSACYSGRYYWKRKSIKEQENRKKQLRILSRRLEDVSVHSGRRSSNVIEFTRRRKVA